jgi:hypothetical protein
VVPYNGIMQIDELVRVLGEIRGTRVSNRSGMVAAHVPAIGDTVRLIPEDVLGADRIAAPTGAPAVQLGIRRGHERLPLIVTVDDVVFMPAYAADVLEQGVPVRVPDAPDLVAYSEMHRDVQALGRAVAGPHADLDADILAATLLVHRCFLAGAVRIGLWPVQVAAWWQSTAARAGDGLPLPPFRADPAWERLMTDVARARAAGTVTEPGPVP